MKRILGICMALSFIASVAVVGGCNSEDTKNYDVPISWTLGGNTDCSWPIQGVLTPIDDMTVTVLENEDDAEPIDPAVTVPCADLEYTIPRLKRGTYFVEVVGIAEYDDDDQGLIDLPILKETMEIQVPYQDTHNNEFLLIQAKGAIHVTWSFDNLQMCGPNGVTSMDINLYPEELVDCNDGQYTIEGVSTFEETNTLSIDALDDENNVLFSGDFADNPFMVLPGEVFEAPVILE